MAAETWWDLYRNGEYWFTTSARSTRARIDQACEYLSGAEGVPVTATANGSRTMTPQNCETCGNEVHPLEVFPTPSGRGILCLNCYADSLEGRRMRPQRTN